MTERMTSARLQELREAMGRCPAGPTCETALELIAEVDRLTADLAAVRERAREWTARFEHAEDLRNAEIARMRTVVIAQADAADAQGAMVGANERFYAWCKAVQATEALGRELRGAR